MRQHSIIRHALMALCAYLAIGIAMAQAEGPVVTLAEAQRGAELGSMTDCQAVMSVAHEITHYLGAEEVARQLMSLPKKLNTMMNLTPESLRELLFSVVGD